MSYPLAIPVGEDITPPSLGGEGVSPHEADTGKDYLSDVPLRDEILTSVGAALYLAASPDLYDGLSETEFAAMRDAGPAVFSIYEKLGRVGLPESYRLPDGFADHFSKEVLSDVAIIRGDAAKQLLFRTELRAILTDPNQVKKLYTKEGTTFSDVASRIAGSNRVGKFYNPAHSGSQAGGSKRANDLNRPPIANGEVVIVKGAEKVGGAGSGATQNRSSDKKRRVKGGISDSGRQVDPLMAERAARQRKREADRISAMRRIASRRAQVDKTAKKRLNGQSTPEGVRK